MDLSNPSIPQNFFQRLPPEMVQLIISHLPHSDRLNLTLVSKFFYKAVFMSATPTVKRFFKRTLIKPTDKNQLEALQTCFEQNPQDPFRDVRSTLSQTFLNNRYFYSSLPQKPPSCDVFQLPYKILDNLIACQNAKEPSQTLPRSTYHNLAQRGHFLAIAILFIEQSSQSEITTQKEITTQEEIKTYRRKIEDLCNSVKDRFQVVFLDLLQKGCHELKVSAVFRFCFQLPQDISKTKTAQQFRQIVFDALISSSKTYLEDPSRNLEQFTKIIKMVKEATQILRSYQDNPGPIIPLLTPEQIQNFQTAFNKRRKEKVPLHNLTLPDY